MHLYKSGWQVQFKYNVEFENRQEYIKQYYKKKETQKKQKLIAQYYKHHVEVPRFFAKAIQQIMGKLHDVRRKISYKGLCPKALRDQLLTGYLMTDVSSAGRAQIDFGGEFSGAPGTNFSRELARLIKENQMNMYETDTVIILYNELKHMAFEEGWNEVPPCKDYAPMDDAKLETIFYKLKKLAPIEKSKEMDQNEIDIDTLHD